MNVPLNQHIIVTPLLGGDRDLEKYGFMLPTPPGEAFEFTNEFGALIYKCRGKVAIITVYKADFAFENYWMAFADWNDLLVFKKEWNL